MGRVDLGGAAEVLFGPGAVAVGRDRVTEETQNERDRRDNPVPIDTDRVVEQDVAVGGETPA